MWLEDEDADLRTPPGIVGAHEHAQIAARLDGWAAGLAVRDALAVKISATVLRFPRTLRIRYRP